MVNTLEHLAGYSPGAGHLFSVALVQSQNMNYNGFSFHEKAKLLYCTSQKCICDIYLRKSCLLTVSDQFSELQGPEKTHKLLNKVSTYFSLLYAMDFKRKLHCYNFFWQWSAERAVYDFRSMMFPHINKLHCPHIAVWCSGLVH